MTTIVYHNNIIAVDSRLTACGVITDDDFNKIQKLGEKVFVFAGNRSDEGDMINAYHYAPYNKDLNINAVVVDSGVVYICGLCSTDGFWKTDITDSQYALGSGSSFALVALDFGCNASQAVKAAMKRCVYTGGKIRTLKVKK